MTLKTSLFNFGIYKNTISRFKWGSVLYFVILFCAVPFGVLTRDFRGYSDLSRYKDLILSDGFTIFPMLFAIAVPTVAAVLILHNMHSAKQSIALHSLPVTRKENYISEVLAGLTLLIAPVFLNGIILLIMSLTSWSMLFNPMTVLYWFLSLCAVQFIMFSISIFAGFITGNPGAHIVLNILLHCITMFFALAISLISDIFLFGFVQSEGFISNILMDNTPVIRLFAEGVRLEQYEFFRLPQIWWYLAGSLIVYGISYFVYSKRKVETCGDVAGFKSLKPILKYGITLVSAVLSFALFYYWDLVPVLLFFIVALITAVVYFAAEMLLNKTFKVFGKYKGLVGFYSCLCAVILFFAYTNVFGYETRIPEAKNVKAASVFGGYGNLQKLIENEALISDVISIHKDLTKNITVVDDANYQFGKNQRIRISYELENGKKLDRLYYVTDNEKTEILKNMYEYTDYKHIITDLYRINPENVDSLLLSTAFGSKSYEMQLGNDSKDFMAALVKDIDTLGFEDLNSASPVYFGVTVNCTTEENVSKKYFKNLDENKTYYYGEQVLHFYYEFNSNHKNVIKLLKERGYYDILKNFFSQENLYLLKHPVSFISEEEPEDYKEYSYKEEVWSIDDCVKINAEDTALLFDELIVRRDEKVDDGEYYRILWISDGEREVYSYNTATTIKKENIPEFVKKYLN